MEEDLKEGPSSTGSNGLSSGTSEKHPAPTPTGSAGTEAVNKRRRGLGVVTPNACTECRKKRAKCDGQRPCTRCKQQKDVDCVYEVPVRQSKENLRNEIEHLRRQQRQSDHVLSALAQPQLWDEVLTRLRSGEPVDTISEWLGSALPSTGGAVPNVGRPEASAPLSGLHRGSMAFSQDHVMSQPGLGTASNVLHAAPNQVPQPGGRQEYNQGSPWNHSQGQTVSTRSSSNPEPMQWQSDAPPQTRVGTWVQDQSAGALYRGVDQVLAPLDWPDRTLPPPAASTWTNVTQDTGLVQHLLALYFCWEYPTFASLSKEHFLADFMNGRHRFCSPILVNALLALGCRFSSKPNTRLNPNDPYTSGDHFFKEALRLLYRETNHHTLTTIQALGIMSIREASCGRDSESWYYAGQSVRMAVEMGLHVSHEDGDEDELAVQAATFWGAFALDHAWSLATGSLPQSSCFPHLPPKPTIIDDIESSLWVPYTDDGAPLQRSCEQPSNVRSVYKCFCELSELVHQSLYILHSPSRPVTSRDLLNIYTQYLNWYDRIPEVLRLGHNFTPAVLFAHMYYHFAILLLFRPMIKLRIIGSAVLPRDVCTQAADAIQSLLKSYSQLYTLQRTPSFVPYFVLTSAIMHLAVGSSTGPATTLSPAVTSNASTAKPDDIEHSHAHPQPPSHGPMLPESTSPAQHSDRVAAAINQGIADLTEMAPCHHFAEQALHILRYLAKKWNIEVNIPRPENLSSPDLDKLVQTSTGSLNFFAPNIVEDDLICAWGTRNQQSAAHGPPDPADGDPSQLPFPSPGKGPDLPEMTSSITEGPAVAGDMPMRPKLDDEHLGSGPAAHKGFSLESPLFWPFPMQGRPMLPSGTKLKEAGFEML